MVFPIAAIIGAALIGGAASLGAGAMQANAAKQASDAQASAADNSLRLQERIYDENVTRQAPWLEAGRRALAAFQGEMGLSDEARAGTFSSGFRETPGYQFQVQEGEKGVVSNLAALGMKNSGSALKALTRFRQGVADQTYGTYVNRLQGAAGMGQTATAQQNADAQSFANNSSTIANDAAAARASGYIGSANAWSGALGNISNIAGNALGMMPAGSWSLGGNSPMRLGYQAGV